MLFFSGYNPAGNMEKTDRLQDIQDTKSQVLKSSTLEAQYSVSAANGDSATVLGLLRLA